MIISFLRDNAAAIAFSAAFLLKFIFVTERKLNASGGIYIKGEVVKVNQSPQGGVKGYLPPFLVRVKTASKFPIPAGSILQVKVGSIVCLEKFTAKSGVAVQHDVVEAKLCNY